MKNCDYTAWWISSHSSKIFDSLKATTKTKKVMQRDSRFWDKKFGIKSDSKRIKSDSKRKSLVNKQCHTLSQHKAAF